MVLNLETQATSEALSQFQSASVSRGSDQLISDYSEYGIPNLCIYPIKPMKLPVGDMVIPIAKEPESPWFSNVINKISKFRMLQENWDEYGAKTISTKAIFDAVRLLSEISQASTPEPYIFPTATGGIQIEWHTEKADLEVEVTDDASIIVIYEGPGKKEKDGDDWEQKIYSEDLSRLISCIEHLI